MGPPSLHARPAPSLPPNTRPSCPPPQDYPKGKPQDLRKAALKSHFVLPPLSDVSELGDEDAAGPPGPTPERGPEQEGGVQEQDCGGNNGHPVLTGPPNAPPRSALASTSVAGGSLLGGAASAGGGSMGPPPPRPRQLPQAVGWQQYWEKREAVTVEGR